MGADVRERARGTAQARIDAPVAVLGREQPVLEVGAVQEADRPGRTVRTRSRASRRVG